MGQPGNVSINHAGFTNFWNFNYNSLTENPSSGFLFFEVMVRFLNYSLKYGSCNPNFFFNSFFFSSTLYKNMKGYKLFRSIRLYSRILGMTNYYLVRRRVASYLNAKYWIYKFSNWIVVNWYSFKVYKFTLDVKKRKKIYKNYSFGDKDTLLLKFFILKKFNELKINQNVSYI